MSDMFKTARIAMTLVPLLTASVLAAAWLELAIDAHVTRGAVAKLSESINTAETEVIQLRADTEATSRKRESRMREQREAEANLSSEERRDKAVRRALCVILAKREHVLPPPASTTEPGGDNLWHFPKSGGNIVCAELLDDPNYAKYAKILLIYQLYERSSAARFRDLNLTSETRAKLLDILVEKDFRQMDLGVVSAKAGLDRSDRSIVPERIKIYQDEEKQIKDLLGEQGYRAYFTRSGIPELLELAEQLEIRLSYSDEPLTPAQSELIRTARPITRGKQKDFDGPSAYIVVEQAAEWLTPKQYAALQQLRNEQRAYAKVYGNWTGRGL